MIIDSLGKSYQLHKFKSTYDSMKKTEEKATWQEMPGRSKTAINIHEQKQDISVLQGSLKGVNAQIKSCGKEAKVAPESAEAIGAKLESQRKVIFGEAGQDKTLASQKRALNAGISEHKSVIKEGEANLKQQRHDLMEIYKQSRTQVKKAFAAEINGIGDNSVARTVTKLFRELVADVKAEKTKLHAADLLSQLLQDKEVTPRALEAIDHNLKLLSDDHALKNNDSRVVMDLKSTIQSPEFRNAQTQVEENELSVSPSQIRKMANWLTKKTDESKHPYSDSNSQTLIFAAIAPFYGAKSEFVQQIRQDSIRTATAFFAPDSSRQEPAINIAS